LPYRRPCHFRYVFQTSKTEQDCPPTHHRAPFPHRKQYVLSKQGSRLILSPDILTVSFPPRRVSRHSHNPISPSPPTWPCGPAVNQASGASEYEIHPGGSALSPLGQVPFTLRQVLFVFKEPGTYRRSESKLMRQLTNFTSVVLGSIILVFNNNQLTRWRSSLG